MLSPSRPVLWLEVDGVLNVNAPDAEGATFSVVDDEPVWTLPEFSARVLALADVFDIQILTYRSEESSWSILSSSGITERFPVTVADRSAGWDALAARGFDRSKITQYAYGKLPAMLESNSPGVWIDPEADGATAAHITDLLALRTAENSGLTASVTSAAIRWADSMRAVGEQR